MIARTRLIITWLVLCHLLTLFPLVTSRLLAQENLPAGEAADTAELKSVQGEEDVTIRALEQEKAGAVYTLRGHAEIHYSTYILYADEVIYDSSTGECTAEGHVVLNGGPYDEHIEAGRAVYNLRTEVGRFESVIGTIGIKVRSRTMLLTSPNPFAFTGKVVEKTGPQHYLVHHGTVTTCELPHPKWEFRAQTVKVDVDGDAKIYRSSFFIRGIPVFYFPFATHPTTPRPRQSGFLIPNVGHSSTKGTILGESVYWAINRTMDAIVGAEYFSIRGWAQNGVFRARPTETSFLMISYFGVMDRGFGDPKEDQGGENARLVGESKFGRNFRAVANIDYLSSYVFRLAFNEVYSQAVYSEVKSTAFLSNTTNGFTYNADLERYQNFESTTPGDVVTILHTPSFESSGFEHRFPGTPLFWSYDAAGEGLSRSEPGFRTANLVGRFDLAPGVSLPLHLRGWAVRPAFTLRDTWYSQQLLAENGTATAADDPINRKALETSVEILPPALDRVFDKQVLGRKWKHVVEPRVVYRYTTGVNNFPDILRFDERDILTNTNEVEYSLVNRLYAKRTSSTPEDCSKQGIPNLLIGGQPSQSRIPWEREEPKVPDCPSGPSTREVVSWELTQKYYLDTTFGGALVPGQRNVFTYTADLTGIAFLTGPRHLSPLVSRLRFDLNNRTDAEWQLDYDFLQGRINSSNFLLNYHLGEFTIGGGDTFMHDVGEIPPPGQQPGPTVFNQFRFLMGYGYPNKRGLSAAANIGYDAELNFLLHATGQLTYNWDCCGIAFEYRRFALGSVRNENQYRFTFSLANIGAVGNLRRQERLF
jgi:LPS-assembly protein